MGFWDWLTGNSKQKAVEQVKTESIQRTNESYNALIRKEIDTIMREIEQYGYPMDYRKNTIFYTIPHFIETAEFDTKIYGGKFELESDLKIKYKKIKTEYDTYQKQIEQERQVKNQNYKYNEELRITLEGKKNDDYIEKYHKISNVLSSIEKRAEKNGIAFIMEKDIQKSIERLEQQAKSLEGEKKQQSKIKFQEKYANKVRSFGYQGIDINIGKNLHNIDIVFWDGNNKYNITCRCSSNDLTYQSIEEAFDDIINFITDKYNLNSDDVDKQFLNYLLNKDFFNAYIASSTFSVSNEQQIIIFANKNNIKYKITLNRKIEKIIEKNITDSNIDCNNDNKSELTEDQAIEIMNKISKKAFPSLQHEWFTCYRYKEIGLFQYLEWNEGVIGHYVNNHFENGLTQCLNVIKNEELSIKEITLAKQFLIGLATCYVNRGSDIRQNKGQIVYSMYKENLVFKEAAIEYAVFAHKLIASLFSQAFFKVDYAMLKNIFENCITQYSTIDAKLYQKLITEIHDDFTYNHSFSNMVNEENTMQYWTVAEYIDKVLPELKIFETNDGNYIYQLKQDLDCFEELMPLQKLLEEKSYWTDTKAIPDYLEFDFRYPNGQNGDMIRYILEEYGEAIQKSATVWHGKISKEYLDLFEIFSVVAAYITYDPDFYKIYEYHVPTILYSKLHKVINSRILKYSFYKNLDNLLYKHKTEQKQKRSDLYAQLIVQERTSPKWKSEAQLYALVVNKYPDAVYQYRVDWLGMQSLDIYIPSLSVGIEYQGAQHYKPIDFFGGESHFKHQQENDIKKRKLCKENGVKLIEWPYNQEISETNLDKFIRFK